MGSPSRDIFTAWQTLIATLLWGLQLNNTVTQYNVQRKHERMYIQGDTSGCSVGI